MMRPYSHQSQHHSRFRGFLTLVLCLFSYLCMLVPITRPAAFPLLPLSLVCSTSFNASPLFQRLSQSNFPAPPSRGTFQSRRQPCPNSAQLDPRVQVTVSHSATSPSTNHFASPAVCWCRLSTPSSPAHASSFTKHFTQDKNQSAQLVLLCMRWIKPNHISDWRHCFA